MRVTWETAILAFGLLNAALFSSLLPLWEGFDEAYHYGYVEELWQTHRLPVLRRTVLPYDVEASFRLAPVSYIAQRAIPEATTYDEWVRLPESEREQRLRALSELTADARPTARGNYEAHQPPLAYLLLAPLDWALSRFPLPLRVFALRLLCGIASVLLVFFGTRALCRTLAVPAAPVLFTIFCSEMFYAATAHVANDWLAIGIGAFFFAELAKRRSPLRLAAWLAAGLLAKAYFLVLAVFLLRRSRSVLPAAGLVLLVAGPWYVRNLALYGNPGGSAESFDGVGVRQTLAAARHIDWPSTIGYLARASLWTGNNSFNTYSRTTLNLLLVLLAIGLAVWLWRRPAKSEWRIGAASLVFLAAILYEGCAMVAGHPGQSVAGSQPWYTQVLLAPVWALAYRGLSRWLALATVTVSAWILACTWTVKLFPMYLRFTPAPEGLLDAGRAAVLGLTVAIWVFLVRQYATGSQHF